MTVPLSYGKDIIPSFCNGRELRDYQKEGVLFLLQNARENRNSLLGDEMGWAKYTCFFFVKTMQKDRESVDRVHPS